MSSDTSNDFNPAENGGKGLAASLLFAPGRRPDAAVVAQEADGKAGFQISLNPMERGGAGDGSAPVAEDAERWLELLASGMTFDLSGLAPGPPSPLPSGSIAPALAGMDDARDLEAVALRPGPHLAGGAGMMPVIRCLAMLTAHLAELPALRAVAWHPSGQWTSPDHFRSSVSRWLDGGAFPGLALASLIPLDDGGLQSLGLALFTGQELRLRPGLAPDAPGMAKLALRVMHWLVDRGGITQMESVTAPEGQRLIVEPGRGPVLTVRRG